MGNFPTVRPNIVETFHHVLAQSGPPTVNRDLLQSATPGPDIVEQSPPRVLQNATPAARDERREAARAANDAIVIEKAVKAADASVSNRKIAKMLGVDEKTVRNDSAPDEKNTNKNNGGGNASADNSAPAPSDAEPAPEDAAPSTRDLLSQSDQNDWRTPRKFLDAAREVMGAIDLDPATSAEANDTVKAETFYTEANDGLQQPWRGSCQCQRRQGWENHWGIRYPGGIGREGASGGRDVGS